MLSMVAGVFFAVYVATFTSEFMLTVLSTPIADTPGAESVAQAKQYIATYLSLYTSGDLNLVVAVSVGLLLGSIIFVPFSGYIIHGVVSASELTTVKNGDAYRIGDSIVFQFISSFTFIQLVGLTVISEILTIDTPNPGLVTVFVWVVWIALTLATSLLAWVVEYVSRKFGKIVKFGLLGLLIIALGSVVLLDPNHATTLFGAAPYIFDFIQTLAGVGGEAIFWPALIFTAGVIALALIAVGRVASKALELPELPSISKDRKKKNFRSVAHPTRFGFTSLASTLLFRYPTVIRPIATSVMFSVIIVLVLDGASSVLTTLIVLPLAVGISFGANMFGLFGNSNNWLLSLPVFREHIVKIFAVVITAVIGVIYLGVYGIAFVVGKLSVENILSSLPSMLCVTAVVVLISLFLSVTNPLAFSAKTRENVVSSPLVLIGYVTLYISGASLFGNLPTVIQDPVTAWIVSLVFVVAVAGLILVIDYSWRHNEKWAQKVLTKTVNAG